MFLSFFVLSRRILSRDRDVGCVGMLRSRTAPSALAMERAPTFSPCFPRDAVRCCTTSTQGRMQLCVLDCSEKMASAIPPGTKEGDPAMQRGVLQVSQPAAAAEISCVARSHRRVRSCISCSWWRCSCASLHFPKMCVLTRSVPRPFGREVNAGLLSLVNLTRPASH